uniref:DNA-directed RNA polymerase n=1 Tax=Cryptomonas curvata TaxID=233186 RepID=A0A222AHE2_9CRYP|nr:RNA polymerase beta'' subunit [Cryptomonas curvata]ASO75781.1 RNA polymerase beta'' subunit [Cryptomonas curvata]
MKEKYLFLPPKPKFTNKIIDKKELKRLMAWAFSNYGTGRASYMADRLKELGFHYATRAGISLSVEDLRVPPTKENYFKTNEEIKFTEQRYDRGEITAVERFQKVIDTWNNSSESLKDEVIKYFKETDPLNPVYIMAFSGARGNISQVKQLVGMRGLMSDPHGQIIDLPIKSNFREGLTVTEYVISCYGARKGLVDTALRTADSGYLTRRLVDVAQDIIIREVDCGTTRGIVLKDMLDKNKILISLESRLLGRVLFETLYTPDNSEIIAHINQDLDSILAKQVISSGIRSVLVRSPLTCESSRSVCQFCYGWSLAHGSLVDLGEAVGIIAAQSIGEPGTQLTMRTFHTGGVFTGELAEQIRAPFNGVLRFPQSIRARPTRTRHGEEALILEESIKVDLYSYDAKKSKRSLNKGQFIVSDNEEFKDKQVIGEISARGNLITERVTKDLSTNISGEVYFSDLLVEEKIDRQGNITLTTSQGGLLWILAGDVYNIPTNAEINVRIGQDINVNDVLATTEIISDYGGTVRLSSNITDEIQIITASTSLEDSYVVSINTTNMESPYFLKLNNDKQFLLHCSPGNKLTNSQILAELIDNSYNTCTGGFVKYSDPDACKITKNKRGYEVIKDFTMYWIPEETHEINKDISLLMVSNGEIIEQNRELIKDLFNSNSGLVCIHEENGIVKEITIKPGYIHRISDVDLTSFDPQIFEKGQEVCRNFKASETSFIELIENELGKFLLIRPVDKYIIKESCPYLKQTLTNDTHTNLKIDVVQRALVRDGERVKSANPVNLLKTYLVLNIISDLPHLSADVEFIPLSQDGHCQLKLVVLETLSIKKDTFGEINTEFTSSDIIVKDGDKIDAGAKVAETKLLCRSGGEVRNIYVNNKSVRNILLLTESHKKVISIPGKTFQVSKGDLVRYGDQLAEGIIASDSGQIIELNQEKITIRSGRPYLVSSGAILQVNHLDLIQTGDILAILVFERSKTGDIVQGLPRIEEILEARKPKEPCRLAQKPGRLKLYYNSDDTNLIRITETNGHINEYTLQSSQKFIVSNGDCISLGEPLTDGAPNPHEMLGIFFNFYKNILNLYEAAKLSLQKVQIYLVNEVQTVYQSQNVDISDKHIEVIVRQMTSKVRVEDGGDTTLLPGELVELQQIENINEAMLLTKGLPATYSPVLLGITKSSLNTDSFISAASFQETTRVLTEAAIEGKADWLRGLKENVIIGRLIPAGTGFNSYNENSGTNYLEKLPISETYENSLPESEHKQNIGSLILDDKAARNYSFTDNNNLVLLPEDMIN